MYNLNIVYNGTEEGSAFIDKILNRDDNNYSEYQKVVDEILIAIKENGDSALFEYCQKFDSVVLNENNIKVTDKEINKALENVDLKLYKSIEKAAERIKIFHQKQKQNSWIEPNENGETLGQLIRALDTIGVYVPGGKAAYPSTVLMDVIPAKVAGVKRIVMVTPCNESLEIPPVTLAAAKIAGVDEIYKIGGAHAIAALAYGTQTIPKVDKIVGPGNIYVALAKKTVYGNVDIDSVAGPSEILIIADSSAVPEYVAADLLSQAEHDEMASAVLVTPDEELASEVEKELEIQIESSPRKDIIIKSLSNYGGILITKNIKEAFDFSNDFAPEHLEVCVSNPFSCLGQIKNAGAIFLGNYSPESLGDYMAGPNHVLPTGGTAKFYSPLSVDDYVKKSSIISFSEEALMELSDDIIRFAESEGLFCHGEAVRKRTEKGLF